MRIYTICLGLAVILCRANAFVSPGFSRLPTGRLNNLAKCTMNMHSARLNPLLAPSSRSESTLRRGSALVLRSSGASSAGSGPKSSDGILAEPGTLATIDVTNLQSKVRTATWLSWWAQTILSVVAAVTIFFANAVKGPAQVNIFTNGIFLAGIGLAVSFINVFWTWGYSRMGNKLTSGDAGKQVSRLRSSVKLGVIIALVGQLITLVGAQQIVGTLVAKAISGSLFFSQAAVASPVTQGMQLQALDIFVVQANTNTLLSHLVSIISSLYIATRLPKQ